MTLYSEIIAIMLGLGSAIVWGAGDFCGGISTKRNTMFTVMFFSQIAGWLLLTVFSLYFSTFIFSLKFLLLAALTGIIGVTSLGALYHSLSTTKMGIVAPVAAITSAVLPAVAGSIMEGVPAGTKLVGFGFAFVAVWFLSSGGKKGTFSISDLKLPFLAGCGFGLFYVLFDHLVNEDLLWPLVIIRLTVVVLMFVYWLIRRPKLSIAPGSAYLIALAGIFDTGGNVIFGVATTIGRLDISSVLGSLYPVTTVILAWFILKEKLTAFQWIGVLCTGVALGLISI